MFLTKILQEKRNILEVSKKDFPLEVLKDKIDFSTPEHKHNFRSAISRSGQINLIAEIKRASPRRGILVEDFDPVKIAEIYQKAGANALSIITEEKFFGGHLSIIEQVKKKVDLPILRKDFIFDDYQIYESKAAGADCLLLIAGILSEKELSNLINTCRKLNLEYIVEVHNAPDVKKALEVEVEIMGINNRDLNSFEVDLKTSEQLKKLIPPHKLVISESGIKNHHDVLYLKNLGINAVLVGESLLVSNDIFAKTKELLYGC